MFKNYIYSENNELNDKAKEIISDFFSKILDTKIGRLLTDDYLENCEDYEMCLYHENTEELIFSICLGSVENDIKPYYNVEDGSLEEFDNFQELLDYLEENFDDILQEIKERINDIEDEYDEKDEDEDEYDEEW